MYWAKVYGVRPEIVVAICDEDIIDKALDFKKGARVKVSKDFYGERLVDEKTVLKLLENATIGNLFGKEIVTLAKKNGFISQENIINIDGVPHAQFVTL